MAAAQVVRLGIFIWLFLFTLPGLAETVLLEKGVDRYPLGLKMDIWEDARGTGTIEEVSSRKWLDKFKPCKEAFPDFGFTSSVIWIRLEIDNRHPSHDWYLELGEPWLDEVAVFQEVSGRRFTAKHMGSVYPFAQRDIPYATFVFPLTLSGNGPETLFIRLATNSKMRITAVLRTPDRFLQDTDKLRFGLGLYFGIMLVMVLYNFFLFLSVRDVSYLYYVLYTASMTLYLLVHRGFAYQYLWPESPQLQARSIYAVLGFSLFSCCLFTHSFLQTVQRTPILHKVLWVQAGAAFLLIVFGVLEWNAMSFQVAIVLGTSMPLVLFIGGFLCWRKGSRPALYFLFAWSLLLLGAFVFTLRNMGVLGESLFTEYGMYLGSAAETILLSLGLADRINALEREHVERIRRIDRLKDQFLANTSHELRTPLVGIIGLAESLKEGAAGRLPAKARDILKMVISSGHRLHHLVNDILDFSKLKNSALKLNFSKVDPHALTEVVLTICRPLTGGRDLKLINDIPLDSPSVKADENRFQQILYNLIGNAIKFTEIGSIRISTRLENQMLAILVTDSGMGIAEEDHDRIFDFFEQADLDSSVVGTGIGLAVTRQLVELHGGEIKVTSKIGEGSCFSFTLPLHEGETEKVKLPTVKAEAHFSETKEDLLAETLPPMVLGRQGASHPSDFHILIVDDEHINRQVLINYLSISGFKTTEAINGPRALQLIETQGPFDMVILDVLMPKMSGLEVCKAIRLEHPPHELPVILLTALDRKNDLAAGFEAGAVDYLTKPTTRVELLARVKNHLDLLIAYRTLESRVAARTRELEDRYKALRETTLLLKGKHLELELLDGMVDTLERDASVNEIARCLLNQGIMLMPRSHRGMFLSWDESQCVFEVKELIGFDSASFSSVRLSRAGLMSAFSGNREELGKGVFLIKNLDSGVFGNPMPRQILVMEIELGGHLIGFLLWDFKKDEQSIPVEVIGPLTRFRRHGASVLGRASALLQARAREEKTNREYAFAQSLQKVLLPDAKKLRTTFRSHFVLHRSCDQLSGDGYWLGQAEDSRILALLGGSVSGPGSLLLSIMAINILCRSIQEGEDRPQALVSKVYEGLAQFGSSDFPLDIGVCRMKTEGQSVDFCGIGIDLFGVHQQENRFRGFHQKGDNRINGSNPAMTVHSLSFNTGDFMYLATPSLLNITNPDQQKFGVHRLQALLETVAHRGMDVQKERLLEALSNFQGYGARTSNITLLGIGF